jgi:hypothetical protein
MNQNALYVLGFIVVLIVVFIVIWWLCGGCIASSGSACSCVNCSVPTTAGCPPTNCGFSGSLNACDTTPACATPTTCPPTSSATPCGLSGSMTACPPNACTTPTTCPPTSCATPCGLSGSSTFPLSSDLFGRPKNCRTC